MAKKKHKKEALLEVTQPLVAEEVTEVVEETTSELVVSELEAVEPALIVEGDSALEIAAIPLITDHGEILKCLEAVIFASPKTISLLRLKNLLTAFHYDVSELSTLLDALMAKYENSGFQLVKVAGGYQFRTHVGQSDVLQKLLEDKPMRLGKAALEVLAIVSYKQPVTRSEIDAVRGVDSGHLMKGLIDKNLVRSMGHAETPGRPLLYGTAPYFLEVFGLGSLDDLPAVEEFDRELRASNEGLSEENLESGMGILEAEPQDTENMGLLDRFSPLAAEPDRGNFDQPSQENVESPDFGLAERAREEIQESEIHD